MVTSRPGRSTLGCLFTLLIVVAVGYFGFNAAEVYVRFYRFQDAMTQEARFARQADDDAIRKRLRALVDSLGLPEEAGQVRIRRSTTRITISSEYHENIELPGLVRAVRFAPTVSQGL